MRRRDLRGQLWDFWALPSPLRSHLERALDHAQSAPVRAWKAKLAALTYTGTPVRVALRQPICRPVVLLRVVEALVEERRLSRAQAIPIEERLLRCNDASGSWYGMEPLPSLEAQPMDLARLIELYWR